MSYAYSGVNSSRMLRPLYTRLQIATSGYPFTNASMSNESQRIYMRSAGSLDIKYGGEKDVLDRTNRHYYTAELKVNPQQQTLAEIMNYFAYSTDYVQAYVNIASFKGGGNYFYNFVDNAGGEDPIGGTAPASGSAMFGLMPKWLVDDKKNEVELDFKTELWDGEHEWLIDPANTAAAATGGSAGVTNGITAMTYNRNNNLRGGCKYLKIGGNDVGIRKAGFKFEMSGVDSGTGDHKNRPICNQALVKCEFIGRQLGSDLLAAYWASGNDQTIEIGLACGYKILLTGQPFSVNEEITIDEKDSHVKYAIEGRIVYPSSFATTPDTIDFGITTPGTLNLSRVGF
jgi:hypothetical protein